MLLMSAELSNAFVVCMGIGIVFVGLICLIGICKLLGYVCQNFLDTEKVKTIQPEEPVQTEIPNRQEFVAAVSAAIAEDMGTDVTGIRILSIKKL